MNPSCYSSLQQLVRDQSVEGLKIQNLEGGFRDVGICVVMGVMGGLGDKTGLSQPDYRLSRGRCKISTRELPR